MIDRRRASILTLLVGGLFAATVASPAQAEPPTRETEPPFDFDSNSLFCGFPLRAETLRNNVKITTFSDGRQLVTGGRTVRLSNLPPASRWSSGTPAASARTASGQLRP